ncbi:MAG: DUF1844 domain-containing protein [Bacteroidetes bacterium]|nr:DUF1844 domain-containing protein [Bacteroidota bacterium]NCQ12168.1 DUF1844 domain-containing protein [Bacteroidota bacterium]
MDFNGQKLSEEQQNQLLFMMLVQQHEQICMMSLGKLKNPATDKIERDLSSAKYAIDTLAMLEQFTLNNLSAELKGYLKQVLNTLRLNYVDEVEEDKKAANPDSSESKAE